MKLRLIDKQVEKSAAIEVRLEDENQKDLFAFTVDDYTSPYTANFRETLSWYFREYPFLLSNEGDDKGSVKKTITYGQYMGDALLGEDHELNQIVQKIEEVGYANVQVSIESPDSDFLDDYWETVILPESKYVLSAVCKEFSRNLSADSHRDVELEFNLQVTPPIAEQLTGLNQEGAAEAEAGVDRSNDDPLRILHLVVSNEAGKNAENQQHFGAFAEKFAAEGAIHYEIAPISSLDELKNHLSTEKKQYHFLHLDGVFLPSEEDVNVFAASSAGDEQGLSLRDLATLLVEEKIPVLCVDPRGSRNLESDGGISGRKILHKIASIASKSGIGNVVGLSESMDPWISNQCYNAFYLQVINGLSLGQAVVEARKQLQSITEINRFTSQSKAFHYWSQLLHFSRQDVSFFSAPQARATLEESQHLINIRKNLLGFPSACIKAPFFTATDKHFLSAIKVWNQGSRKLSLLGERGVGKTHILGQFSLYLTALQKVDYAFYFDFSGDFYSPEIMQEMIAPVFGLESENKAGVITELQKCNCVFALDGLFDSASLDSGEWDTLNQFMTSLTEQGHTIVATGHAQNADKLLESTAVALQGFSRLEQQIFAAEHLRRNQLEGKDFEDDWDDFLASTKGNPFLLKQLTPLLKTNELDSLNKEMNGKLLACNDGNDVDAFYRWQWEQQTQASKKLLYLFSSIEGLILDMLMIACDQKEGFAPAKELFKLLGDENIKLSEILANWESNGFINSLPHGRIIEGKFTNFLTGTDDLFEPAESTLIENENLQRCFSLIVCEGIRMLSSHVVRQQNQALLHNLLMNRHRWVAHFERLWFAGEYRSFIGVKNAFEQLLQQVNLQAEMADWSLDLIERSAPVSIADDISTEAKLTWLIMAASALTSANFDKNAAIETGVSKWQMWFDSLFQQDTKLENVSSSHGALLNQVVVFLESFYQRNENWDLCIDILERSYDFYASREVWVRIVTSLKSLAVYSVKTGAKDKALEYERRIIEDVPYEDAPPGYEVQQLLDIALARIARKDPDNAEKIVERLKEHKDSENLADSINGLQADISFQQKDYKAAMPCYCKLWEKTIAMQQAPHIEQLKKQFVELKKNLGKDVFNELFDQYTSEDTPLPSEYAS